MHFHPNSAPRDLSKCLHGDDILFKALSLSQAHGCSDWLPTLLFRGAAFGPDCPFLNEQLQCDRWCVCGAPAAALPRHTVGVYMVNISEQLRELLSKRVFLVFFLL